MPLVPSHPRLLGSKSMCLTLSTFLRSLCSLLVTGFALHQASCTCHKWGESPIRQHFPRVSHPTSCVSHPGLGCSVAASVPQQRGLHASHAVDSPGPRALAQSLQWPHPAAAQCVCVGGLWLPLTISSGDATLKCRGNNSPKGGC